MSSLNNLTLLITFNLFYHFILLNKKISEQIVLPLLTIQQYALKEIQKLEAEGHSNSKTQEIFEKIVTRSLFGNINASRNSA